MHSPIVASEESITTLVKDVHFMNEPSPIDATEEGIVIYASFEQL